MGLLISPVNSLWILPSFPYLKYLVCMQPFGRPGIMLSKMKLTDAELQQQRASIERAKHDPEAFGELFDAHYSLILNYIARRTGDIATAQDLTSIVFIKALDGLPTFTW